MHTRFELIVFDWDGTLMDSAGAIVQAIQYACDDIGIAVPSERAARHIIGLGLQQAIEQLLPDLAVSEYPRLVERYRHHFLARDHDIPLFDGAQAMVAGLHDRGCRLAVATGKSRQGLDRALATTGLTPYFHATRCADECFSKPHPEMLLQLMDALGASREQTLMIGDTSHDLQMAQNAGVAALAVSYGAHPREELAALSPLACVDNLGALQQWLTANA